MLTSSVGLSRTGFLVATTGTTVFDSSKSTSISTLQSENKTYFLADNSSKFISHSQGSVFTDILVSINKINHWLARCFLVSSTNPLGLQFHQLTCKSKWVGETDLELPLQVPPAWQESVEPTCPSCSSSASSSSPS